MNAKQIFLKLTNEIISGKNPNRIPLSVEETRVLNYINGIRALNKLESKLNESDFFLSLSLLYKNTEIPLLKLSTSTLLFKKFNRNKAFFDYLTYTAIELKNSKFIKEAAFWEMFIESLVLGNHIEIKFLKTKIDVFIKFAKLVFTKQNFDQMGITFGFLLNHENDNISKALLKYHLGMNLLGFKVHGSHFKYLGPLFKILKLLKKAKAEPKTFEFLLVLFANKENASFAYEKDFLEFFNLFLEKFHSSRILKMDRMDYSKLYFLFVQNQTLMQKFNAEDFLITFENTHSVEYGSLRKSVIEHILSQYGISYFFIKNFNEDSMDKQELNWFIDVVTGKNLVYSKDLPVKLNKKVVHKFNTVSNEWLIESERENYVLYQNWNDSFRNLSVNEGLIWSAIMYEVKNIPYTSEIIQNLRDSTNATFWVKVMTQLYRNRLRENDPIHEIMDYIQFQVFTARREINFKTKKAQNIIAESNEWHEAFGNSNYGMPQRVIKLPKSNIDNFYFEEDNFRFLIKQLKTNKELFFEGNMLKHCVGSYTNNCLIRGSFIFSLRQLDKDDFEKRLITIEVFDNRIFQKRGKHNRSCLPFEDKIIADWAQENKILL